MLKAASFSLYLCPIAEPGHESTDNGKRIVAPEESHRDFQEKVCANYLV